ncbi:pyruvate kinase [Candidatus Paracaedibacter symbiosus]|uniref:pyruvate kinase n=1 Tax=Candidatus Paracaedibacter symbiosus TaxID=244582 RepID=UPI0005094CEC|nr:pyruvate kinase [Candidatus Paracaedibacter symbiosus]
MLRSRKAKIVATLGPASNTYETIKNLHVAGADVFRLNFSHGTHAEHQQVYSIIRDIEAEFKSPIAILADLQGPKIRIHEFENKSIMLAEGQQFILDNDPALGNKTRVFLPHPELFQAITPGLDLLLDDGKVRLHVIRVTATKIVTTVTVGGALSNRKGLNIPGVTLPISALTPKDREDLDFALSLGVDWVALSFVQRPEDIIEAKHIIQDRALLVAKIEKPKALEHLVEIVTLTDAVMVARGDLGVEMLPEDVPSAQKRIIRQCREQGKPVIVATQMLDSMIHTPSPTRAEASDVATAIYDAVDAVMLSAESASGSYPVEAVSMMHRIIKQVEEDPFYSSMAQLYRPTPRESVSDALTAAARKVAQTIKVKAIVTFTETGTTTLMETRERPKSLIMGLTPNQNVARRMGLFWGTYPVLANQITSFQEMISTACKATLSEKVADVGDRIIILAGVPFAQSSGSNIMRVIELEATCQED